MGSADDALPEGANQKLREKAEELGLAIGEREAVLLSGATTGVVTLRAGPHINPSPHRVSAGAQ